MPHEVQRFSNGHTTLQISGKSIIIKLIVLYYYFCSTMFKYIFSAIFSLIGMQTNALSLSKAHKTMSKPTRRAILNEKTMLLPNHDVLHTHTYQTVANRILAPVCPNGNQICSYICVILAKYMHLM